MINQRAQINYLLRQVEKYHTRPIKTTVDFEALSTVIEHQTSERISASTLKRMWGYVSDRHSPRRYTLDVLSKYIGCRDFDDFCKKIEDEGLSDSDFFTPFMVASSEVEVGSVIEIGWNPDRFLKLEYLGGSRYKVTHCENSKLAAGDEFTVVNFMLGYPLYIPSVMRDGKILSSFVGGKNGGITILTITK